MSFPAACCSGAGCVAAATPAARALASSRSRYSSGHAINLGTPNNTKNGGWRRSRAPRHGPITEARVRPGRQGVQRIYRMTNERSKINVYEYLESIGVPRVNALQVYSKASEWQGLSTFCRSTSA